MFRFRWWMPWRRQRDLSNEPADWCINQPEAFHAWSATKSVLHAWAAFVDGFMWSASAPKKVHAWTVQVSGEHAWTTTVEELSCG